MKSEATTKQQSESDIAVLIVSTTIYKTEVTTLNNR